MLFSFFFLTLISYTDDRSPISSLSGYLYFHHIACFLFNKLNFKPIFPMPPVATIVAF